MQPQQRHLLDDLSCQSHAVKGNIVKIARRLINRVDIATCALCEQAHLAVRQVAFNEPH
jgi:hypothetical protein